jgi:hypothetical protein
MASTTTVILEQLWASMEASAGVMSVFKTGNMLNYTRTDGAIRDATRVSPTDFPSMRILPTGGRDRDGAKTFGYGLPTSELDYAVPIELDFEVRLIFDQLIDEPISLAEEHVEVVLRRLHIDLLENGVRWVRGTTYSRDRRNVKNNDTGNVLRTVTTYRLTVRGRPMLSQLTQ